MPDLFSSAGLDPARAFPMPKGYVEEKGKGTGEPSESSPAPKASDRTSAATKG